MGAKGKPAPSPCNVFGSSRPFEPLDPSACGARIKYWLVYEGFNASEGLQPSVYTGLNASKENLVTESFRHLEKISNNLVKKRAFRI